MTEDKITELQSGFNTAFIDGSYNSNLAYRPQFIYNDNKNGQKVFSTIEDELLNCDSFAISVAFITRGGMYHYYGTANKNYHEYLTEDMVKYKKYFYVLRPIGSSGGAACEEGKNVRV